MVSQEYLQDLFEYQDGKLIWKKEPPKKRQFTGTVAGWQNNRGYYGVRLSGRRYLISRLVWEYHHGPIPDGHVIDHIDHDRKNNRIENLRAVPFVENMRNQTRRCNNTSGRVGVRFHTGLKKWTAEIGVNGENKYIGIYTRKEDAIDARLAAERQYGFHENHGKPKQ